MTNIILLVVSLLIGIALRHVKSLPSNAHSTLGALILYVPMPAICLLSLPDLSWNMSLLSLTLVAWIIFGLAYFLFNFLGEKLNWDKSVIGCLILNAGFANTAFVGYPIVDALYGKEALKLAIFLDQSGSFLLVSSLGIWVALTYSSGKMRKRVLLKKILLFPPFIAFIAGILGGLLGWRAEGVTREVLEKLASLLTPMALISVGLQLRWDEIHEEIKYLVTGLSYKLLIAPFVVLVAFLLFGVDKEIIKVSVIEAGMSSMVTASILAASHHLRPRLAGMMVGVGVPLSAITLAFWYYVLTLI